MEIELTAEHEDFRSAVRKFLGERSGPAQVRTHMESDLGYDPAVWRQMADQLGLQGLVIPEEYGGSGFGLVELSVAFEECGRALLCAPLLGTVLASVALLESGDAEAAAKHLPGIASGRTTAALAVADDSAQWPTRPEGLRAHSTAEGIVLEGHRSYVVDGMQASLLIVSAEADDGIGLFLIDDADRVRRTALPVTDQTRQLARLEFERVPASPLRCNADSTLSVVFDKAATLLAAEQLGGARRCMELTVEYVKSRRQFGRLLGSFQAIKHRLADTVFDVENSTSAVRYATASADGNSAELALASALARVQCSDTFTRAANTMLQLHGGIGFTWEHDTHLYLKRAKSSELLFGSPSYYRELIAQRAGF